MPWLHALLPQVSRAAAFVYYRVRYTGEPVPRNGPVLLVANHPNSLLDPMLVAAAARRPVRFLAKAPLFADLKTAWLVKGAGAIPVYRRADDPSQMDRNADAFRAVHSALADGAAVGIFPEGLSHSEPALAPLKTGAARIALGGALLAGTAFPIIPLGLVFRRKDAFRSEAVVLTGRPIVWHDLAARGTDDAEAVRDLTARIEEGLRHVTVNLERWQDRPLVDCAVRVWEAHRGLAADPGDRVTRLAATTRLLAEVRRRDDAVATTLAADVERHRRRLERLRLRPGDLTADVRLGLALRWTARRSHLLLPLAALVAVAGLAVYYPPYRVTGWVVSRVRLREDERSTWKLLVGIGVYGVWVAALLVFGGLRWGLWAALALLVTLPLLGT
ncbi:MAG TPA: 1-acyl-sn-glycerol-3-phosphate acyltransferase, partial [Gemmatimonadales bacterium]|nr:1-acyl-sn-glycerol-3-phosphate acyltransferase [Gemmatimonadales bacterium]